MAETAEHLEQVREGRAAITETSRIDAARSWAGDWIDQHDLELIAFSRAIGFGDSGRPQISNFLRGKLQTDASRLVLAIEQFRASVEGPEGISAVIGFRETASVLKIWAHVRDARDNHKMAALIGYTGYGKTEALRQFQRRARNDSKPPVRMITCNVLINAPFLARKLALEMGAVEKSRESAMCLELVVRQLRASPEFWIIDEANFLQERALEMLRHIHDVTGTGMILAGTPTFLSMIANRLGSYTGDSQEGRRRSADGPYALFADRVFTEVIPGAGDEEACAIAEEVLNAEFGEAALSKFVVYVNHNMRLLTRMILVLREFRKQSGRKKLDEEMIDTAWAKLQHLEGK